MKFTSVNQLRKLIALVEAGKPVPPRLLAECQEALERERKILADRSFRTYEFFEKRKLRG